MSDRSFTIVSIKNGAKIVRYNDGRFISKNPGSAVSKVFTKAYHHLGTKGPLTLTITIRETTQGSHKKEYTYRVKKVANKQVVEINGEEITFNFSTHVRSI